MMRLASVEVQPPLPVLSAEEAAAAAEAAAVAAEAAEGGGGGGESKEAKSGVVMVRSGDSGAGDDGGAPCTPALVLEPLDPMEEALLLACARGDVAGANACLMEFVDEASINVTDHAEGQTALHIAAALGGDGGAEGGNAEGNNDDGGGDGDGDGDGDGGGGGGGGGDGGVGEALTDMLLANGADPTIRDRRGRVPFYRAATRGIRNVFRTHYGLRPDQWDWKAAAVEAAGALVEGGEDKKKAAAREKKKRQRARKKERAAAKREGEAEQERALAEGKERLDAKDRTREDLRLQVRVVYHIQCTPIGKRVLAKCYAENMNIFTLDLIP